MTNYRRGDVVLLPFPFTDAPTEKKRPAVIVSAEDYMRDGLDLIVAMISSSSRLRARRGDYSLKDWRGAGLIGPSVARMRLATISQRRVVRKLGSLDAADMNGVEEGLRDVLAL